MLFTFNLPTASHTLRKFLFGGSQSFDDVSWQREGSNVNLRVVVFRLQVERIPVGEVNVVGRVQFLRREPEKPLPCGVSRNVNLIDADNRKRRGKSFVSALHGGGVAGVKRILVLINHDAAVF